MANKAIFPNKPKKKVTVRVATPRVVNKVVTNEAGGIAYKRSDIAALTQYVVTGVFDNTYYTSAASDLKLMLDLVKRVDPTYIAKLAVYARTKALMKDTPIFLLAYLSKVDLNLFYKIFDKVINNAKTLRTFVQIMRSGVFGGKSLGTGPKKAVQKWINAASDRSLLNAVGNSPSLADVIKLCHVKPVDRSREVLYKYLLGRELAASERKKLPEDVLNFEKFKATPPGSRGKLEIPKVDFRLLDNLNLTTAEWTKIALNAPYTALKKNLNTFQRHGVFNDRSSDVVEKLASKLESAEEVRNSTELPYGLFAAWKNAVDVPPRIRTALSNAMELACRNAPDFSGRKVAIGLDVSGSMNSLITGKTSTLRYIDVASLFAATILRTNTSATLLPFDTKYHKVSIGPGQTIAELTNILSRFNGGGTDCSIPFTELVNRREFVDVILIISDNESWANTGRYGNDSAVMAGLKKYRNAVNPNVITVCIDIAPVVSSQVKVEPNVLRVGGFTDAVFNTIDAYVSYGGNGGDGIVNRVERIAL